MVLPNGRPPGRASELLGCPSAERVSAVQLVERFAELSARKGYKIFLLGARAGITSRVVESLSGSILALRSSALTYPSNRKPEPDGSCQDSQADHATQPDILLVDSGDPKQEEWTWTHRNRLGVPPTVGVAGSFHILACDVRRTPQWIQRFGLEWAIPSRRSPCDGLHSVLNLFGLLSRLPMALLAARSQRTFLFQSRVTTAVAQRVLHLHIYGRLGAESAAAVQEATTTSTSTVWRWSCICAPRARSRPVDSSPLEMRRQLLAAGLDLPAGLGLKTRFMLRAWYLQQLFDEWQPVTSRRRRSALVTEVSGHILLGGEAGVLSAPTQMRG